MRLPEKTGSFIELATQIINLQNTKEPHITL